MRKFLFAATLLSGVTAAYAQLPDAYVGAGVTQARIDNIFGSGRDFDLNNTAWKAYVGIRPIPYLGIEANYMTWETNRDVSGSMTSTTTHTSTLTHSQPLQWASFPFPCRSWIFLAKRELRGGPSMATTIRLFLPSMTTARISPGAGARKRTSVPLD